MMKKEWIFLGVYYATLIIAPLGDVRLTFLTILSIISSIIFIVLYRIIGDEILFYVYNFVAVIGIVFSLGDYNPYSPITLAVAYIMLSLMFLHIIYARFEPMYGKVKIETVIYMLLSLPMAYLSVYLFLIYPIGYGFWGMFILVVFIIILIYFLMRSSKSKDSSYTS